MARFILVDPSIIDFQGHYYEYALRVLTAAEEAGYVPVLATNRRFKQDCSSRWQIHPVYRHGFYTWFWREWWPYQLIRAFAGFVRRNLFLLRAHLLFSWLGILWTMRDRPRDHLRSQLTESAFGPAWLTMLMFIACLRLISALSSLIGALIPFQGYLHRVFMQMRRFLATLLRPLHLITRPDEWLIRWWWEANRIRQFGRDTRRLFQQIHLQEGDVIFFSLVSWLELTGLAWYLERDKRAHRATWHLLFRHQLYGSQDMPLVNETLRPLRSALYRLHTGPCGQRLYFYADTQDLVEQYSTLGVPFHVLPIPINQELYDQAQQRILEDSAPLRIAYVGDARKEKGYHHLPGLIQDLWSRYVQCNRVNFVIQSNFNVPGGTAHAAVARAQLETFPRDKVTLLMEPLNSQEYARLIVESDIILLPYDREIYYAGSSGILAEALAAGVPVVVPQGLWMTRQLMEPVFHYHNSLKTQLVVLESVQGLELAWQSEDEMARVPIDESLTLTVANCPLYSFLEVPPAADFLLIMLKAVEKNPLSYLEIYVDQLDKASNSLLRSRNRIGVVHEPGASHLVSLMPGASHLYLSIASASPQTIVLCDLQFTFLARKDPDQPCPVSVVGLSYYDPDDLSAVVGEIIDHYAHYRQTARAWARQWFSWHNARRLVATVTQAVEARALSESICVGDAAQEQELDPTPPLCACRKAS